MRHYIVLTFFFLVFMQIDAFTQKRTCGTMDHFQHQKEMDPELENRLNEIEQFTKDYQKTNAKQQVVTIPIVFHVVFKTPTQNISDAQVLSQLQVLNDDFRRLNSDQDNIWPQAADTEIEFCLATLDPNGDPTTGITRTSTNVTNFGTSDDVKFDISGGIDAWPTDQYLNVWVCQIGGGILGYGQFPGGDPDTDGVVCDYKYFGTIGTASAPFDLGRTATHEVGHYLNLRHIWGDGDCPVDDFVADTPRSDAPNFGCAIGHQSCSSTDMVQNYMDYSDDGCMNLFTLDQKSRMHALFAPGGDRNSLLDSDGCSEYHDPCPQDITLTSTTGGAENYEAASTIHSTQVLLSSADVTYMAGTEIVLQPGFWAKEGSDFHAFIGACNTGAKSSQKSNSSSKERSAVGFSSKQQASNAKLSCHPNPFNQSTTITFELTEAGKAELSVLDLTGREITQLSNGFLEKGIHQFTFIPAGLAPGVYLAKLATENSLQTTKMIITR